MYALYAAAASAFVNQDKELPADAKLVSATLFFNGVQLQNEASASLGTGKTLLKIRNISSYADEKSLQVSGQGSFTILSVNYKSAPVKPEDSDEYKKLKKEIDESDKKINEEKTWIEILQKREAFYDANMKVTSANQLITVDQLKALGETYSKNIETIRFSIIEKLKKIEDLGEERRKLNEKLNLLSTEQASASGEIWVLVSATSAQNAKFFISYFTYNAGWYPSYDLRVNKLNEPMSLTYKANIYQNSGLDWKNIKIKCSNATPYQQGNLPDLEPYYLYFGNTYQVPARNVANNVSQANGVVRDANTGEALPFVSVQVKGTNYGTTTDLDGKFKLNIPAGSSMLEFKYVGYDAYEVAASGSYMTIDMRASQAQLEEVVIVSKRADLNGFLQSTPGVVAGRKNRKAAAYSNTRGSRAEDGAFIPEVKAVSAATSVDFDIAEPYSVKSDGAVIVVDIQELDVPAIYEYHSAPKIEPSAFLIARIPAWEKYNLLAGDANLYIENTFVGKSTIDVSELDDTLDISLGRDKNVIVKREKVKDFTQRRFLGTNTTITRAWKISVKSNKSTPCQVYITDQLPISENKDISIEKLDISGAKENTQTGLLEWKLDLQPNETKELNLKYAVKYPKNNNLIVE